MSVFGTDVAGVEIATVVANNDPDYMGRIQVSFPSDPSIATAWAKVVQPLAGNNYGVYILPEVGDQVLVAFAHNNHSSPVVIGSIYNAGQSYCADPDNYTKNIKTKGGNEIRLYDKPGEETISIRNTDSGSYIKLTMENSNVKGIKISSPDRVEINAPQILLNGSVITLQGGDVKVSGAADFTSMAGVEWDSPDEGSINMEANNKIMINATNRMYTSGASAEYSGGHTTLNSDQDMKITAGTSLAATANTTADLKANAQMTVESSGQTAIKGAIVMIN